MDELIIRVLSGDAEPIEERRLSEWRAETPQNDQHFQDVAAIWQASEAVPDARISPPPAVETIVLRGEALRRRDERRRFARGLSRRENWPWAAAAAIAAISLGVWIGSGERTAVELAGTEFIAGSAEATTSALSDGSFVRLDAGSAVRFVGGRESREAWLSGRAFFGVASDPRRPFVVHTDLGDTRVLGTRFEVSSRADDLRVIVVEGRVAVTSTLGRSSEVAKGQMADWDRDLAFTTVNGSVTVQVPLETNAEAQLTTANA